jgi:hypothetical protein
MAISLDEVLALAARYHHLVGIEKGDAAAQATFFLHPNPVIIVAHASDLTLQANHEIHKGITDEEFFPLDPWDITQLCDEPERARAVGAILWHGRSVDDEPNGLAKTVVGEDWIVQRADDGELKFALYINTHHQSLPSSATFSLP